MTATYEGDFGTGTVDDPLYGDVTVHLTGTNSNAWAVVASVLTALRRAGASPEACLEYHTEALSGSYDKLLHVTMCWVQVT